MTDEWSYGLPVQTDNVNYEWSFGSPYIISQYSGITQTLAIVIDADTTVTLPIGVVYKIDGTVDAVSTILSALTLVVDIPVATYISSVSYIGSPTATASGFNLDGFNISGFNAGSGEEIYTLTLDTLRAAAVTIGAETTVLDDLEIISPFVIDAVSEVLSTLGKIGAFEIEINAQSGTPALSVFGVDAFGAFIFGPAITYYPLSVTRGLNIQVDSVTTITELASQIRGLFLTTDAKTVFTLIADEAVTSLFNINIDSLSDVIFTLHVEQGYPLRVKLSTTKRPVGISTTKRVVALNVDR